MPAPPACLDECTDLHLVRALGARGYDVTSLRLVGPVGLDDGVVLERATELGRVLITHNTDDFRRRDAEFRHQGRRHAGVICLAPATSADPACRRRCAARRASSASRTRPCARR